MARFFVVYRIGGTMNAQTKLSCAFESREAAEQSADAVRRGGREAHVEQLVVPVDEARA